MNTQHVLDNGASALLFLLATILMLASVHEGSTLLRASTVACSRYFTMAIFSLAWQQFERSQAKMLIKNSKSICVHACVRACVCDICADQREKQQACRCRVNRKSEWVRK